MKLQDINLAPTFKDNVDKPATDAMSLGSEGAQAAKELADRLDKHCEDSDPDISYNSIDSMMTKVCDDCGCTGQELRDRFVAMKGMTPDEYARQLVRNNRKRMVEAPWGMLNEGPYDDRVQQIADRIIHRSELNPLKKEDLTHMIEVEAGYARIPEYGFKDRASSRAWPDFVKDVLKALKGKVVMDRKRGPSASAAMRREEKDKLLRKVASIIEDAVGMSFPDGDPADHIYPRLERMGIYRYDIPKWMDQACKKFLDTPSFDKYMTDMYDAIAADDPHTMIGSGIFQNPYSGKDFNFIRLLANHNTSVDTVIDVIASAPWRLPPASKQIIADNKDFIVKSILRAIKQGVHITGIKDAVDKLKNIGMEWPELEAITQAIHRDLRENMEPGDILTIERANEAISGVILSVEGNTIIVEGEVIQTKFGARQAQKGKTPYSYNADIAADIPLYDPNRRAGTWHKMPKHAQGDEVPFTGFEVKQVNDRIAHIMGVAPDGKLVQVSTTVPELAHALADAYNRGGFTDKDIEKVPFGEDMLEPKERYTDEETDATFMEAEYHGREVKLGKPMAGDVKKYKVYVRDPKTGNIKKVNFGDKGMEIKRDDPERRKNFRARHGCGTPRASDRTKAAYWSCRMWSSKPVSKILKGK